MAKDIREYIKSCDTCQRIKYTTQKPSGLLHPPTSPARPWTDISMDFLYMSQIHVPQSQVFPVFQSSPQNHLISFAKLWVIVDRHTKFSLLIPVPKSLTATQLKDIYDIQIFPAFGYPSTIVSDRDILFTSDVWQGWCEENGIEQSLSTSYHPETDGQTVIVNKAIPQIQRAYALENISWIRATPKI